MKRGFTLIELMILVMVLGVLALALYPSYNSIQTRAQEAKVRANMSAVQIAVEEFATMTDGFYPQNFIYRVIDTNPNQPGNNTSVAGTAGGTNPVASTPADPVLLPINFRNPVSKTAGWAFSSAGRAITTPPSPPGAIVAPAVGAACDQGSVDYTSADILGGAAQVRNAKIYIIWGYGVNSLLPGPLTEKQ
jgi:prepilin-type N-terminal cleavage/methylation domain-containing protein